MLKHAEGCKHILNEMYDFSVCKPVVLDTAGLREMVLCYGVPHEHRFAIRFQLLGVGLLPHLHCLALPFRVRVRHLSLSSALEKNH